MQDTIFKVKAELGSDAIILNTRKYKVGGIFGFFGKEKVEVLAGLEENSQPQPKVQSAEIDNLKEMIRDLKTSWQEDDFAKTLSGPAKRVYQLLMEQQVEEELARDLTKKLQGKDEARLQMKIFQKELQKIIGKPRPLKLTQGERKVVALVGATGVGKTTTIAKLAARQVEKGYQVGLITSDTYRIAAVQQLKTYSDIINIPLEVVYNDSEFAVALANKFRNFDLVLVDTPGSSWKDQVQLGRLKSIMANELIDEIHLLLCLNTKSKSLQQTIDKFSALEPNRFLLTKLDEDTTFGDILNIRHRHELPYSYYSFGQDVPDDLDVAHPEKLIPFMLGDNDG